MNFHSANSSVPFQFSLPLIQQSPTLFSHYPTASNTRVAASVNTGQLAMTSKVPRLRIATPNTFLCGLQKYKDTEDMDLTDFVLDQQEPLIFPQKLMLILTHVEKTMKTDAPICWDQDGRAFLIRDCETLEKKVLPLFFGKGKYSNFTRNLYRWSFRLIRSEPSHPQQHRSKVQRYGNEFFQRDKKHLMAKMRISTAAKRKHAALRQHREGVGATDGGEETESDEGQTTSTTHWGVAKSSNRQIAPRHSSSTQSEASMKRLAAQSLDDEVFVERKKLRRFFAPDQLSILPTQVTSNTRLMEPSAQLAIAPIIEGASTHSPAMFLQPGLTTQAAQASMQLEQSRRNLQISNQLLLQNAQQSALQIAQRRRQIRLQQIKQQLHFMLPGGAFWLA